MKLSIEKKNPEAQERARTEAHRIQLIPTTNNPLNAALMMLG
jgi:hypothetical protein